MQWFQLNISDIGSVNINSPIFDIIKAIKQINKRCLSATGIADKSNLFAVFCLQIDVLQNRLIFNIFKINILILNGVNFADFNCVFFIFYLRFSFHQLKNTLNSQQRNLNTIKAAPDTLNRIIEQNQRRQKRNKTAGCYLSRNNKITSRPNHKSNTERNNHMHKRWQQSGALNHLHSKTKDVMQSFMKALSLIWEQIIWRNNAITAECLIIMSCQFGICKHALLIYAFNFFSDHFQRIKRNKKHNNSNNCQLPRIVYQHKNQRNGREKSGWKFLQIIQQSATCRINITVKTLQNIAWSVCIKKSDIKSQQLSKQINFDIIGNSASDPSIGVVGNIR